MGVRLVPRADRPPAPMLLSKSRSRRSCSEAGLDTSCDACLGEAVDGHDRGPKSVPKKMDESTVCVDVADSGVAAICSCGL